MDNAAVGGVIAIVISVIVIFIASQKRNDKNNSEN